MTYIGIIYYILFERLHSLHEFRLNNCRIFAFCLKYHPHLVNTRKAAVNLCSIYIVWCIRPEDRAPGISIPVFQLHGRYNPEKQENTGYCENCKPSLSEGPAC